MNDNNLEPLARRARELHQQSLEALSPRTRAQLHNRLRAVLAPEATQARRRDWRWAAAPALALALAFALPWQDTQLQPPAGGPQVASTAADAAALMQVPVSPLEQDPEFYAWLASADALALASE